MLSCVFFICMHYFDLYDSSILSNRREVLSRLVQALGTVCILVALVYYLDPPLELGRGITLIGVVIVAIILALWRGLFSALNQRPQFAERTMIFGDGRSAARLFWNWIPAQSWVLASSAVFWLAATGSTN